MNKNNANQNKSTRRCSMLRCSMLRRSIVNVVLSILIFATFPLLANEPELLTPSIIGEAFDLETAELRYRESYFLLPDLKTQRVVYHDQYGKMIAEKTLEYGGLNWQPNMSQENQVCGEAIDVDFSDDSKNLSVEYRADSDAKMKQKKIKTSERLVVDAGFNALLLENWQNLIDKETIRFDYLAPSQLDTFLFQAENIDCQGSEGVDRRCFSIKPKRWWMKVLLDPIILSYDSESRKLLSFKGLGNIADENCDYMKVDIRYQYFGD